MPCFLCTQLIPILDHIRMYNDDDDDDNNNITMTDVHLCVDYSTIKSNKNKLSYKVDVLSATKCKIQRQMLKALNQVHFCNQEVEISLINDNDTERITNGRVNDARNITTTTTAATTFSLTLCKSV